MTDSLQWAYTDITKEHFINPRNVLGNEDEYAADGKGLVGNIKCGDQMLVVIKVNREDMTIADCKWKTYGCASAIASTSILSEVVKGKTLKDAYNLSPKEIAQDLGGLPENKVHCSVLGDKALRAAIDDFYSKNEMTDKIIKNESKIVCDCMSVTDHEIEEAVLEGARTLLELQEHTKIGTACGNCIPVAEELLEKYIKQHFE